MKSCSQIPCGCGSGCRRPRFTASWKCGMTCGMFFKCFRFGKRRWPWSVLAISCWNSNMESNKAAGSSDGPVAVHMIGRTQEEETRGNQRRYNLPIILNGFPFRWRTACCSATCSVIRKAMIWQYLQGRFSWLTGTAIVATMGASGNKILQSICSIQVLACGRVKREYGENP